MEKLLYATYRHFHRYAIGRILIGRTEFEVGRYLPFDDYGTGVRTVFIFFANLLKAFAFFFLATVISKFAPKYIFSSIIIGIAAYKNGFIQWQRKQEVILLKQLSAFISELRHAYYRWNDVEEAFSEAFHSAGEELKLHLGLIEDTFEHGDLPEKYKVAVPPGFLLVLLAICRCTIRYGDKASVFVENLDELQKGIDSDLLKWEREAVLFSAVFTVMAVPILCLPLMEAWAIGQLEELRVFYNNFTGSLLRFGVYILSFPVFLFSLKIKETGKRSATPFMSYLLEVPPVRGIIKALLASESVKKGRTAEMFKKFFPNDSYLHFMLSRILCFAGFSLGIAIWLLRWSFPLYFLIFAIIGGTGASFLPYLSLLIRGMYYESELEDEIGRVRLMIFSLSGVSGMTVEEILGWTESFTVYLRSSVAECLDGFGADEEEALETLREEWRESGFINIVDDLIASDKIGVEEAFRDLGSRKEYYSAKRRQEQEFITGKKEAVLNTFMYFPFMVSVSLYMIMPFLYMSIRNLTEVAEKFR